MRAPEEVRGSASLDVRTVLAANEWGAGCGGGTVVLLHGMLASREYWRPVATRIPGRRVVALDLLGFGASPRPRSADYDYPDHCAAILATLEALEVRAPIVLAGHSMGALIALRLAAEQADLVSSLCLVGMPVFTSASEARTAIGSTWMRRALVYGFTSRLFCAIWCQAMRPVSRRIAPLYVRAVPPVVARATVDHSWRSYSRSLSSIVEAQSVSQDLRLVSCPTLVIQGDTDTDAALPPTFPPFSANVRVLSMSGGHQLPVERPHDIAALIRESP